MTTGVVSALKAAGLSGKVKIVSDDGQVANMQAIKDGTEAATVGVPLMMSEWYVADAMARYSLGMSLLPVSKEVLPMQLFTSNNVPNPIAQYDGPTDYQTLFKGLWHV
jgi:ABC-type sugar transport system substrate-binding protein